MAFNKKIAIFDLDGTLTESKQPLSSETAELLRSVASRVKVSIISGASFDQFNIQFFSVWNEAVKNNPEINGNLIIMPADGTMRYEYDPSAKMWKRTYRTAIPFADSLKKKIIGTLEAIIASGRFGIPQEHTGEYIEDRGSEITFSGLGQDAPLSLKQAWDPDQRKRQAIRTEIERCIPEVSVSLGGMSSLDVLPKGEDKATGVQRLIDELGISVNDAVYVGDALFEGGNDSSIKRLGMETIEVKGPKETDKLLKGWLGL